MLAESESALTLFELLTFVLGLIGTLGAFTSWLYIFICNRRKIDVSMSPNQEFLCSIKSNEGMTTAISLIFENKSRLPISITMLKVRTSDGKLFAADLNPTFIWHHSNNIVPAEYGGYSRIFESAKFPIYLEPLGAACEYIHFELSGLNSLDDFDVNYMILNTSRGCILIDNIELRFPPCET